MSLLEILATAAPTAVPEIVRYIRSESDERPVELLHLPRELETELALVRAKARGAALGRPEPDAPEAG